MSIWFYLALIGSAIILVLTVIAARLLLKLRAQTKKRTAALAAIEEANQKAQVEQRIWMNKSIHILAQALGKEDLSLTEASIRICGLLDALNVNEEVKTEFSAFYQLREKTQHIPYLEAWKALSDAEQRKFDLERLQHEATYQDFIMDAAKRIADRHF
jgi:hypothetical protein